MEPQGLTRLPGVSPSQGMPPARSWYLGSEVLGCCTLRLEYQSSAGLRMQPYPCAPGDVWPGHLHGTGCLSVRAMNTGFPTVAWRACLCFGLVLLWLSLVWGLGLVRAQVLGVRLPCSVPGLGLRFLDVGVSCACISPVLVAVCGACVWARVAGSVVRMRVGLSLLSGLSWLGLVVRVRVRVGT